MAGVTRVEVKESAAESRELLPSTLFFLEFAQVQFLKDSIAQTGVAAVAEDFSRAVVLQSIFLVFRLHRATVE